MPTKEDLKDLAKIKLKMDLYTKLYDDKVSVLKKHMDTEHIAEIIDPDGILSVNLTPNHRREFNIAGVRAVFGDEAGVCIKEEVDPKKFDALAKKGKEFIISEDKQQKCFTMIERGKSLSWGGLDVYQRILQEKLKNAE